MKRSRVAEFRSHWAALLQPHGVAALLVMNIEDQFLDPHWRELPAYVDIEHPHVGVAWLYGRPWLLSDIPGGVRTPVPLLGQHNDHVFRQLLEGPVAELKRLQAEQVVYYRRSVRP